MSADTASLARLHDIVVPDPVPWWPPAPGWLWLLGLALVLALAVLLAGFVRWQKRRYRREALADLARLELAAPRRPPGATLAALAELLKRSALTAYPRRDVAALTGPAWFAFLDRTGGTRFADGLGEALERANYLDRDPARDDGQIRELIREVGTWIRRHEPLPEAPGGAGEAGAEPPAADPGDGVATRVATRAATRVAP